MTVEMAMSILILCSDEKDALFMMQEQRLIHLMASLKLLNYSSNWTEEQINSHGTKDQAYFGPTTSLSEVVEGNILSKRGLEKYKGPSIRTCISQLVLIIRL